MQASPEFIARLPKAELHIHIEGSLEPELMFALAKRNRVDLPFDSVDAVRAAYEFSNLQSFLDIYYAGADVLRAEEDFFDLTFAYFKRLHADNGVHAEIFFDPQTHIKRGVPFKTVIDGISAGCAKAQSDLGISSKLILCFLRDLDEEAAFDTLRAAEPWLDRLTAVGLDSAEIGHPPAKFARVYQAAAERGLKKVAHAGEEGPPAYIWEALDTLGIDRMDHGNRSMEDEKLVDRLAKAQMTLTVCPLSNLKLCVVQDMRAHPLRRMLDRGLRVTVNSDDPAYFGGYLNDNFNAIAAALDLDEAAVAVLARNSFLGSFLAKPEIDRHLAALDKAIAGA